MSLLDTALSVVIIGFFFISMYAGIRKKSLKEAWEEIKDLFKSKSEEHIQQGIGELKRKW